MKKKILLAGIVCLLILLSGCISESNSNTKRTKLGQLIDVVYHRGWFDIPNSIELFFFDKTIVVIDDEWKYDTENDVEGSHVIYGVKRDIIHSFCKYNIGNNIIIVYEDGLCHSIELSKNPGVME